MRIKQIPHAHVTPVIIGMKHTLFVCAIVLHRSLRIQMNKITSSFRANAMSATIGITNSLHAFVTRTVRTWPIRPVLTLIRTPAFATKAMSGTQRGNPLTEEPASANAQPKIIRSEWGPPILIPAPATTGTVGPRLHMFVS